jgi:radical SAM/Cys-rich protein
MRTLNYSLADVQADIAADDATPRRVISLQQRRAPLAAPAAQLDRLHRVALDGGGASTTFADRAGAALAPGRLEIFQVNLGKLCNMTCRHCHVDAGPDRTDAMMDDRTADQVIDALRRSGAHTVDLTGGAPELHPRFRDIVEAAVACGKHVLDRCNLTVLLLRRHDDLIDWLARHGVEVVASMPHYRRPNTDSQRGDGVFEKSLEALRRLNAAGYGKGDPRARLTLVSNPAGAFLGASQASLQREWQTAMKTRYGIDFDRLFVLNNMPISRFLEWLESTGQVDAYLQKLLDAFNPASIGGLMCRNTLSVGWDGGLYDCDFNQMLGLPLRLPRGATHIADFDESSWSSRSIATDRHCFGCTAGAGSGCGGQTA